LTNPGILRGVLSFLEFSGRSFENDFFILEEAPGSPGLRGQIETRSVDPGEGGASELERVRKLSGKGNNFVPDLCQNPDTFRDTTGYSGIELDVNSFS